MGNKMFPLQFYDGQSNMYLVGTPSLALRRWVTATTTPPPDQSLQEGFKDKKKQQSCWPSSLISQLLLQHRKCNSCYERRRKVAQTIFLLRRLPILRSCRAHSIKRNYWCRSGPRSEIERILGQSTPNDLARSWKNVAAMFTRVCVWVRVRDRQQSSTVADKNWGNICCATSSVTNQASKS